MNYTQEELKSAKRVKAEILKMDITDFRLIYAAGEINKHNEMRQEMEKLKEELRYFQILHENNKAFETLDKDVLSKKEVLFKDFDDMNDAEKIKYLTIENNMINQLNKHLKYDREDMEDAYNAGKSKHVNFDEWINNRNKL